MCEIVNLFPSSAYRSVSDCTTWSSIWMMSRVCWYLSGSPFLNVSDFYLIQYHTLYLLGTEATMPKQVYGGKLIIYPVDLWSLISLSQIILQYEFWDLCSGRYSSSLLNGFRAETSSCSLIVMLLIDSWPKKSHWMILFSSLHIIPKNFSFFAYFHFCRKSSKHANA